MDSEAQAEAVLKSLEAIGAKVFFEKPLTSSDVSATGRVVVPKVRHMCSSMAWLPCATAPVSLHCP